jgi:hypothetical protein
MDSTGALDGGVLPTPETPARSIDPGGPRAHDDGMSIATNTPLPTLLIAALATLAVSGCAVKLDLDADTTRRVENETVAATGISAVDVSTGNGSVEIVGGAGDEIAIRAVLRESDEGDADYSIETDGDRLIVSGECDSGWFDECSVGFTVTVPDGLDVDVETDNGRIVVDGVAGNLGVETDNGAIEGERLGSARVAARTDNGRIRLLFDAAPESVDVSTDNGAVAVVVPDAAAVYDVDATSDNGSIDVDVRTDPESDRHIVVETDNGSIDVRDVEA